MNGEGNIAVLASLIERMTLSDGDYDTRIPKLKLYRRSNPTAVMQCVSEPGVGLIVQGAKRVMLADRVRDYAVGQALLTSVDMPAVSRITKASPSQPFLGLMLEFDGREIMQVAAELSINKKNADAVARWSIEFLSGSLLDALVRLVRLIDEPKYIPSLAPLIEREIIIRLLMDKPDSILMGLVALGSNEKKIMSAIAWLKENYSKSLNIDQLADSVHMSSSTFRRYFSSLTGTTPIQFQKALRLQEARWLMLNENFDAGRAAVQVGYESTSQFSREYRRAFDAPPHRDVVRLRSLLKSNEQKGKIER
ncbi:AraC family transcriptional regulator [Pseudomonas mandelii]|uniref:AraC family transcriptional regulator n=1 Tax=Pseudomonas mandelii TaxID=75612 RepID=UPI0020A208B4|nr:AraC family transcriptional regulator [Pseudomonas mandelii]MCO8310961.1 AraC family transcriptional regulator [Pseudomonas mandelii]